VENISIRSVESLVHILQIILTDTAIVGITAAINFRALLVLIAANIVCFTVSIVAEVYASGVSLNVSLTIPALTILLCVECLENLYFNNKSNNSTVITHLSLSFIRSSR
jgi:hypothetical protein